MNYLVFSNIYPRMGISPLVRNELAIQVLVVSTQKNITWFKKFHYLLNVEAIDIEGVWVIYYNWQKAKG